MFNNKSILYISSVDISLTSGPAANEREFIPVLHGILGKRSHFLIPKPKEGLPDDIPRYACTFTKSHKGRNPLLWPLHQLSLIRQTLKLLKERDFDMIVMRADIFALAYLYITRNTGMPYAMKTAGNGRFQVFETKNLLFRSLKGFNQWIYKKLISKALMVDVVSLAQRNSLRAITEENEKIVWIDNGVNTDRFQPQTADEMNPENMPNVPAPLIGYAGNLPWDRGGMQIIESLPGLSEKYPGIGAIILGSGSGMEILYSWAEALGVSDRCIFTGCVDYNRVPEYINMMDVAVSLRFEDTQHASELKVRQYLACGKPVIVSPGSNNFVEDEQIGYVVDPKDPDAFQRAVESILDLHDDEYKAMSEKARGYAVKNLSYKSKVEERLVRWQKLLNESES